MLALGQRLASFPHKLCQVGHISWAAGRRPGYLPAFLALCTHDLIPALQSPMGQEALPHSADEEMRGHRNWCPVLMVILPGLRQGTLVSPRLNGASEIWP